MDKEEFKNSLHYYSIPNEQRNALITIIDNMSKITLNEKIDINLLKQLKIAYDVLQGNEMFRDFIKILKDERKIAQFGSALYKARLIMEKEEHGLPID